MPPLRKANPLPPLPFGEARATTTANVKVLAEHTAKALTSLNAMEPADRPETFQSKVSTIRINGLDLVANAVEPVKLELGATRDFHLIVNFFGRSHAITGGRRYDWGQNDRAVLFTECERRLGFSERRSALFAHLDRQRLIDTACAMLGDDAAQKLSLDLDQTRTLALNHGPINFTTIFRQTCQHIDSLGGNQAALEALGLDDMFYRQAVFLLKPQLLVGDAQNENAVERGGGPIDSVCEAVRNSRHRALTLTEMEQISGLSRRSLQYAFQKRFGLSPMAWQQQERLHVARERLLKGAEDFSITQLSYEMGFSTPSNFTAYYGRIFGETPTATILRSRRASPGDSLGS